MQNEVVLRFQFVNPWTEPNCAVEFIDILAKYDDVGLRPERYGPYERTSAIETLTESQIEEYWKEGDGGTFRRKKPWNMVISISTYESSMTLIVSHFRMYLKARFFTEEHRVKRFLDLCQELYTWGQIDHGCIYLDEEYQRKNRFGEGRGVGGPNLKYALPGIYWANFFGPSYVEWFGEGKFSSLETHYKERLPDGGWLLIARPDLLVWDEAKIKAHEKYIIYHLGREAFFEMDDPGKQTITPWNKGA